MAASKRLTLYADFGQIHVCDRESKSSLENAWTAKASEDRIAEAGDIVGIGANDVADVSVSVEILAKAPKTDVGAHDHVTEASLRVISGEIVILGCSDERKKARRFALAAGTWRIRASHAKLAKGREQIDLQLWPAPRRAPQVVKRWTPPIAGPSKTPKKIANTKRAVEAAMRGEAEAAMQFLLPRAEAGDFAAAASAIQILAFQGQWAALVPLAMTVVAEKPDADAGRETCFAACDLLNRAAKELGKPAILASARKALPKSVAAEASRHLAGAREARPKPSTKDREKFAAHASSAETQRRFRGKHDARAESLMAYAYLHLGLDDEVLELWDPAYETLDFEKAAWVARILVRRGEPKRAWEALESRLAAWWPSTIYDVVPLELLTDPDLRTLMTRDRCERILSIARGDQAT